MSIAVPVSAGPAMRSWQNSDWIVRSGSSSPAGAEGRAVLTLDALADDELWLIDHATVQCSSITPTSVRWYDSSAAPGQLIDGSGSGNFDVADWPSGLVLRPSTSLVVVWSSCSPGAVGSIRLQARQLRKVTS